jgi:signal transduction histidine kinase
MNAKDEIITSLQAAQAELLSFVPTGGEPSSGYGLAVAKELIEKLNGGIWCESRPGQGASFAFRLPIYVEEQHGAAAR